MSINCRQPGGAISKAFLKTNASISHGIGTGDFTWASWVSVDVLDTGYRGITAIGSYSPAIYTSITGADAWDFYIGGADKQFNTILSEDTWYHLAVIRDSGTITGYVNGVAEASTYSDSTNIANAVISVGSDDPAGFGGEVRLEDFFWYSEALNAIDIKLLYESQIRASYLGFWDTSAVICYFPFDSDHSGAGDGHDWASGDAGSQDWYGGTTLTNVGGVNFPQWEHDNPGLTYPFGQYLSTFVFPEGLTSNFQMINPENAIRSLVRT